MREHQYQIVVDDTIKTSNNHKLVFRK